MRGASGGGWWVIVLVVACSDGGTQRNGAHAAGADSESSDPDVAQGASVPQPAEGAEGSVTGEPDVLADPEESGAGSEAPETSTSAEPANPEAANPEAANPEAANPEAANPEADSEATDTEPAEPAGSPEPAASAAPAGDPSPPRGNDEQAAEPASNDGAATQSEAAATQAEPGDAPDSAAQPLSFEADIWPVFEQLRDPVFEYYDGSTYGGCNVGGVCHGGERPGAGLRMPDPLTAYDNLVGAESASGVCEGSVRVVPGEPEQSCLIQFYRVRLQYELEWVDDPEIELVERWILDGALP